MAAFKTNYLIVIFIITVCFSKGAKILGVFHTASPSHYSTPDAITKELARRGHEVTVLSPFPPKTPLKNYRHIDLDGVFKEIDVDINVFDFENVPIIFIEPFMNHFSLNATEEVLRHENVQKLLKSNEEFDLVIFEGFLNYAVFGMAHYFNAPYIVTHTNGLTRQMAFQVGDPCSPSYIPDLLLPYSSNMSFFQRVHNSIVYLFTQLHDNLHVLPRHNRILQKYFPGAPHINDILSNVSLYFLNSHVSSQQPVPYVPNVVDIGGIHIKPTKELPKDIQEFLDDAKDGAIFFSMGSAIKSTHITPEKMKAILTTFKKLKQRVLWKFEADDLPGRPSNVKIGKWLPQTDILAHPNVKLFITHGGLLSVIETVNYGVPVVGIPIAGEQKMNIAHLVLNGLGVSMSYPELTEKTFSAKIQEVLNNHKYGEKAKEFSKIFKDNPVQPLEKAMFWVEYILRHKGAPHLRVAALKMSWYQYLLLDVVGFVVTIVVISIIVIFFVIKKMCGKRRYKESKKKNE